MKTIINLLLALTATALMGCTTAYRVDPTTYAHLSCEKLQTMYNPNSELSVPQFTEELAGANDLAVASTNGRELHDENPSSEQGKFRADVRAAYKQNGCS